MKLRPYQEYAISEIGKEIVKNGNALAYLSVGAGKTIIMAELARRAKKNILVTVPKVALIEQTVEKFKMYVDDVGVYCASLGRKDLNNQFVISTLQSISKVKAHFNLIIVDEAHLMENSILRTIDNISHKYVLGLTGTPFLAQNIYGDDKYWNEPCVSITMKQLTDKKYLVPIKMAGTDNKIDLKGVKTSSGDYVASDLLERYRPIVDAQVADALSRTANRRAVLWMTVNIEHAELVHSLVPDSIITHSKTTCDINLFKQGHVKHIISVAQIHTGLDAPIADALVLMRPTKSSSMFVQACGRIVRTNENKPDSLLLDYGRVVENLGDPYEITSVGSKPRELKLCPDCNTYNQPDAKVCTCGEPFIVICGTCIRPKNYGVPCENCVAMKRKYDPYGDLTQEAYSKRQPITDVKISRHKSKSGNDCIKADFYDGVKFIVSEYLNDGYPKKLREFLHEHVSLRCKYYSVDEFFENDLDVKIPKSIILGTEKGYKVIKYRNFQQ